ncbi:hypothetical protein SASPL_150886 [Salvia splendens]|uniref:Uncharacterized protein n=1 Tax=Salvia splendens TaxID=180675 RepID=A0A8X8W7K8_SALSN|nr:hypothetical protein SASPL_150886 [Salvia splendens]
MNDKVLRVGEELFKETLPIRNGARLYHLQGLKPQTWYEVKMSYPASVCVVAIPGKQEMEHIMFNIGNPSEYLLVRQEPTASITAREVKFSEAISTGTDAEKGGLPVTKLPSSCDDLQGLERTHSNMTRASNGTHPV